MKPPASLIAIALLLAAPSAAHAAFPGANGKLVFFHDGIETTEPDGTARTPLVERGYYPAWSPDGTRVAYAAPPSDVSERLVLRVHTLGGATETVPMGTLSVSDPAFAPDGRRIVFAGSDGGNRDLY